MNSGFKGMHPTVNLIFYISVILLGMLILHPVCLGISLLTALVYQVKLEGKKAIKTFFAFLLPMLIFVTAVNSVFAHYGMTVLAVLGGQNLTLESLIGGLVTGMAVVNIIVWFFTYNHVVTNDKFMYLFGKILPSSALIISMALRFLPMYRRKLGEIMTAQKGIGKNTEDSNFLQKIKTASEALVILVTWALENAIETASSMKARGYGLRGRRAYSRFKMTLSDAICIFMILLLDAVIVAAIISGSFDFVYNPVITFGKISLLGAAGIAAYALLGLLPVIIDVKEEIKWYSLKSKI